MTIEEGLVLVDRVIYDRTGKHLSDLQATILREVWQGKKYLEIADIYGCTEGHAKDAGYLLWKTLSQAWGEKITKSNLRTTIKKHLAIQLKTSVNQKTETFKKSLIDISFLGRERAITDIDNLFDRGFKIVVIQGLGGVGKTTLAKQYLAKQNLPIILELLMAKETQNIISVESLVEECLKKDFNEEPGKEFGVTLARLKRCLTNQKVGILIDNLEPALDKNGQLISPQRNYIELLRILADSNVLATTLITSRDRLCESDIDLAHYRLSGLDLASWSQFFTFNSITNDPSILAKIHRIYGGNAKAMGIICSIIKEDFAANIDSYWQENHCDPLVEINLKNLIKSQFDRLHKLDDRAYLLLCRLGCYRYQDIPHISQEGLLFLLWDIETNNQKPIITSLRNRSLIEFESGQYWLHPIIKAEALSRLDSTEWQQVNKNIARFYTKSIVQINTVKDGLIALEAYYHYLAIEDFNAAGKVILFSRSNQWGQYLTLGTHLYRLGLSRPLLTTILQIIERVTEPKIYSELNNILGDLYWISGNIKDAIASQKSTIKIATDRLKKITNISQNKQANYYWKMLQIDSLLSIGLYNIDLWELEKALVIFQEVIQKASNTKHHSWSEKAEICSALVNSYLGKTVDASEITNNFIQLINNDLQQIYNTGRFAYFIQILGQTLINLQKYDSAKDILNKASAFCQESHYLQIKAKALTGLAIIQRIENNLSAANNYHLEAIELLDNIGAKCDLAEACYQYAITLKQAQNKIDSQTYISRAIELFQQIDVPKQIAKVRKTMSN